MKKIGSDLATGVASIGAVAIEKRIEKYTAEKDSLRAFKYRLSKLAAVIRDTQGFPLTIIVDELDRCRPDFALALLERIKHLFDVEGVAFVLLVNRDQIESYIKTVYGDVDARAFILKFANLFVDLPQDTENHREYVKGRKDYCHDLFKHFGFYQRIAERETFEHFLSVLVEHFSITLREIQKVFTVLALYYTTPSSSQPSNEFLIAILAVLKIHRPELYTRLRAKQVSISDFLTETRFDQMKIMAPGNDFSWVKILLMSA